MERSARQAVLAELWSATSHAAVLELFARSPDARQHELIHALHEQSVECRGSAPQVAEQLDGVAGRLAEIHAGLRSAELIDSLHSWIDWQSQAPWRTSGAMEGLLAAVAGSTDPNAWPWRLSRLPALQVELDALVTATRELVDLPPTVRRARIEAEPRICGPELSRWLATRANLADERADEFARLRQHTIAWRRLRESAAWEPSGARVSDEVVLAELVELWYRLDPEIDRTCTALRTEVVGGQRSLTEALNTIASGEAEAARRLHRRAYFLYHLLDDVSVSVRRAALAALAGLVSSPDCVTLDRAVRAVVVLRWATALDLHWHVLSEPVSVFEAALGAVEQCLPAVVDGRAPRLARDLMLLRARLLRHLAGWKEAKLAEAERAFEMALDELGSDADARLRGRTMVDLAALRRGRRPTDSAAEDRRIRGAFDDALEVLAGTVLLQSRALAEYAVYLARPLHRAPQDDEQAVALAERAVRDLSQLPPTILSHPIVRTELGAHLLTLGNVRLEAGLTPPAQRRAAAGEHYREGLTRVGEANEVLAGLLHLNLAIVALDVGVPGRRDEQLALAQLELDLAEPGLRALPVAHGRALAERANIVVRAAPDDEQLRRRCIIEVEAALHRLPVGADRVVRARVQRQLGTLFLGRDGVDDPLRAAEHFAAARAAFVEGGATRLAVEVARDYAESQLRQHADEGDPAPLIRGAMVLEQASLLAERRWVRRRSAEGTEKLAAMLDGVYGDLAWFQAKLKREAVIVLRTVSRAKRFRSTPSLRSLRGRAERSAMLSPAHLDPLARRLPPPPRPIRAEAEEVRPAAARLREQIDAFRAANPEVIALDLTLTRWGTVAVAASREALAYTTSSLTRESVRRLTWGDAQAPGWWSRYLSLREAQNKGRTAQAEEHERAWAAAGNSLAHALGGRLFEPAFDALGLACDGRVLLLASGRFTGLPLASARIDGKPLVGRVRGLALLSSLSALPAGVLQNPRPRRALCVVADPAASEGDHGPRDELTDVVRLLVSARASVEVLALVGDATGSAAYRPTSAGSRERTIVGAGPPSVEAVLQRAGTIDHLYYGGHGLTRGLMLVDGKGRPARLDGLALRRGGQWTPGSSVFVSGATRSPPPTDDTSVWGFVDELRSAGVGSVVLPLWSVSETFALEFTRSFYLYWALGRSVPEALCTALVNVAGGDVAKLGAFVVALGAHSVGE